ncbi:MAG: hypothetical protein HY816_10975 [Candidatus Wallbacteria bacterium]|nr:hypothetical protein [Candidatus Wallbacteria bacterium]
MHLEARARWPFIWVLLLLALFGAPPLAVAQPLDSQLEGAGRNDTADTATLLGAGTLFGVGSFRGAFETDSDVDFYKVRARFGDVVTLRVTAVSAPGPQFGATFFDATGARALPAFQGLDALSRRVSAISFTAPAAADYLFRCTSGITMTRYDFVVGVYRAANANLPDFGNATISAPPGAVASDVVLADITLDGLLSGIVDGNSAFHATAAVLLSPDAVADARDPEAGRTAFLNFTAAPGTVDAGTISTRVTLTIPPVLPGEYQLLLRADPEDLVRESSEANNLSTPAAFTVSPKQGNAGDPDLVSGSVTGPSAGEVDRPVFVSGVVTNSGSQAAGSFEAGFVLSSDSTISLADALLGTVLVGTLPSGQAVPCALTATVPAALPAGSYRVGLIADVTGRVQESDETNNTAASAAAFPVTTPATLADLVVELLTAPSAGQLGTRAGFSAVLRNAGGSPAPASRASLWLARSASRATTDVLLGLAQVPPLSAGSAATVAVTGTFPSNIATGPAFAYCEADSARAVLEASEANNFTFSAAPVLLGEPADLSVTAVTASTRVAANGTLEFSATVTNLGPASTSTTARFFLSRDRNFSAGTDILLGTPLSVATAGEGSSAQVAGRAAVPSGIATGVYFVGVVVDSGASAADPDPGNNVATAGAAVTIVSPADVVVRSVDCNPRDLTVGQTISVTSVVALVGGTSPLDVELALNLFTPPGGNVHLFGRLVVPGLAPGEVRTLTQQVVVPPVPVPDPNLGGANYSLESIADPSAAIDQPRFNDSPALAVAVTIQPPPPASLPNLTVTAVSGPVSAQPGQVMQLAATVANSSAVPVSGPVAVAFFLEERDPASNPAARLPLLTLQLPGPGAGESIALSPTAPVPAAAGPGSYAVRAEVDSARSVVESSELDNLGTATVLTRLARSAALTNLAAVSVVAGGAASLGGGLSVTGTVRNDGPAQADASIVFVLTSGGESSILDPPLGEPALLGALAPGEVRSLSATRGVPSFLSPGSYTVAMLVDPNDFVAEPSELDNVARSSAPTALLLPVSPAALPDLSVLQVSLARFSPAPRFPGDRVTAVAAVANSGGSGVASPFLVRFFLTTRPLDGPEAGSALGSVALSALSSGQTVLATGAFPMPPVPPGDYFLGVSADFERRVPDANRRNNTLASASSIAISTPPLLAGAPDFAAAALGSVAAAVTGSTFPVSVTVAARGSAATLPVEAQVVLSAQGGRVPSPADIVLGRATARVPANASATVSVPCLIRPGLTAGQYRIALVIDPANAYAETDELDNVRVLESPLVAVAAGTFAADDSPPAPGQPVPSSLSESQRLSAGPAARQGLLEAAGDRDAYFFDVSTAGGFAQVTLSALGGSAPALEVVRPDGSRVRGVVPAPGQPVRLDVLELAQVGRYTVLVLHEVPAPLGGYSLGLSVGSSLPAAADLVAGPVSLSPSSPTTRESVRVEARVSNAGTAGAGAFRWELRAVPRICVLCGEGRAALAAVSLGSGRIGGLAALASAAIGPVVTGPLAAGDYDVVLNVDAADEVAEGAEGNNSAAVALRVAAARPAASLAALALSIDPFRPTTATGRVVALGTIGNLGTARAPGFSAQLVLDRSSVARGRIVTVFSIDGLAAGGRVALPPVALAGLTAGAHSLTLEVDPQGVVPRADAGDGRLSIAFGVAPSQVSGFELVPGPISVEPAAPTTRDAIALAGFVSNLGDTGSGPLDARVFLDGVEVGAATRLLSVAAASTATLPAVELGTLSRAGIHRLSVRVAAVAAGEVNPFDNETTLSFAVSESRVSTKALELFGTVSGGGGAAVLAGTRVRALNRTRGRSTARALVPADASVEGSYVVTLGGLDSQEPIAAAVGDELELVVEEPSGALPAVASPATLVVTAGAVSAGRVRADVRVVPSPRGMVTARILRPAGGDLFLADEPIAFEAIATGSDGRRLTGQRLSWSSDRLSVPFGVGEELASRLPAGRNRVRLEARDESGQLAQLFLDVQVQEHSEPFTRRLGAAGVARLSATGAAVAAGSVVTLVNARTGRAASGLVRGGGAYSVTLLSPAESVAVLGETMRLEVRDARLARLPVTPALFRVGLRDLVTQQRTVDLRVGLLARQRRVALERGLNLLSVPVNPDTTGQAPPRASDLVRATGGTFAVRVRADGSGQGRFQLFLPNVSEDFELSGSEGYLVLRAGGPGTVDWSGVSWPAEQLRTTLPRGTGLVGLPFGPQAGSMASELLERSGSAFVGRTLGGRFEVFVRGLGSGFPLEEGKGYIVGAPRPQPLTLPGQP